MSKWEVELYISSHSKIDKSIEFKSEKGDDDTFYSQINISNFYDGLKINIEAIAESEEDAIDAGYYFIGQALNYISYKENLPFDLHKHLYQGQSQKRNARKILTKDDWVEAFKLGREIQRKRAENEDDREPYAYLSMSLSWYRKSLNSKDPIDSFLSRWLVLERLCQETRLIDDSLKQEKTTDTDEGKNKGDIFYKIKQKLLTYEIEMNFDRLYKIKNRRNDIAHGKFAINKIEIIKEIIEMNKDIKEVSHQLLTKEVESFISENLW